MTRCLIYCVLAIGFLIGVQVQAAGPETYAIRLMPPPQTDMKSHTIGNLRLVVTNWGHFGNAGEYDDFPWSCEFPAGSEQDYLFQGALWIGGTVSGDTHVSVGADGWLLENELFPGSSPGDTIIERSNDTLSPYYHPDAVSEQDLIAVFTDTVGPPYAPPEHTPLGIRVTQHSYCWSSDWVKHFVLIRLQIENIRVDEATVDHVYAAIYFDGDVTPVTDAYMCRYFSAQDDITGLRRWKHESDSLWAPGAVLYEWNGWQYVPVDVGGTPKYRSPCDHISVAWVADDNGVHPDTACPGAGTARSVVGTRALSLPQDETSYNWWLSDPSWGPHDTTDPGDPEGTPMGDSAKYAFLSSGRLDPDQVCDGLEYPPHVDSINDTRCLLSFGPHQIPFGDTLEIVWAFVGGERFHDGHAWCEWDFADLIMSGNRAYAVYDNPGIDTDGDGYFGDYMVISDDTLYITGDGVPDFKECEYPPWYPCDMIVGVEEPANRSSVRKFQLKQNFPNPFSGLTRISFSTPLRTDVKLDVFDVCGRLVANVVDEALVPGRYIYDWYGVDNGARRVADGVYFYRLKAGDFTDVKKMVLLR